MGAVNALAVLEYAFAQFPDVQATLTAGQSAGAVGSYVHAPRIMAHWPEAEHAMVADSYVPLFGKTGITDGLENWHLRDVFPTEQVPALADKKYLSYFRGWAASMAIDVFQAFPKARFGVYASNGDVVESSFYVVEGCGIAGCSWRKAMRQVLPWLRGNCSNVFTYIGTGDSHTQTVDDGEYSMVAGGVRLSDWINLLVNRSQPLPHEVDCLPHCGW